MTTSLAFDPGCSNTKVYGSRGGLVMQSAVSVGSGQIIRRMTGLRSTEPPLRVETDAGTFYVGTSAHDWGRPVENLDLERLTGSLVMLALFLGAITHSEHYPSNRDMRVVLPKPSLTAIQASL